MNESQKKELLALARATIGERFGIEANFALSQDPLWEKLRGVFVTLKLGEDLRGCIGYIEPAECLSEAVKTMANQAAFSDPRFKPLSADEFDRIRIEISVLSPLKPIEISEIIPGTHGVVIEAIGKRAVFLPQVATEQAWDRITLLDNLCIKAGLSPDYWRSHTARILAFTAEVFGESEE